jgi:hypothetical protein
MTANEKRPPQPLRRAGLAAGLLACAGPAAAQEPARIYADAVAAVKRNDCPNALPLLERYRALDRARLERHPRFREQLNRQILNCRLQSILIISGKASPVLPR